MANSKQIVYLSQAQYAELIANGSITVNGVTVQYNENDIYVTPQAEPVTDVRVAGTSVAVNGVAAIPVAGNNVNGVVNVSGNQGLLMSSVNPGLLMVKAASSGSVKSGADMYSPIVPSHQDEAAFYGLAKAAGHDEKDSTEPLGTYTPEAKGAIQQMLGVSDLIATAENNLVASKAYKVGDVFTANGKLYKATAAIAADAAIIPAVEGEEITGANCEETSVGEGFVKFTDYATANKGGVIKVNSGWLGTNINSDGYLYFSTPSSQVKQGNGYPPITINSQHEAVFYGLAKAAGADEKDSTLLVGQYTDTAKTAIRAMLGATSSDVIAVQDEQPTNADTKVWLPETEAQGIEVPTMADLEAGYVKKTDYASAATAGISMADSSVGIGILSDHRLYINAATSDLIKGGSVGNYRPITPTKQHESVFYGLAKAAGDTTQSASDNIVGTYTTEAKIAIQTMLGVNENYEFINRITVAEDTTQIIINTDKDNNPFSIQGFILFIQSVGASSATQENYLKASLNSDNHATHRFMDSTSGIRSSGSTRSYAIYGKYLFGLGHFIVGVYQDSAIFDAQYNLKTIYQKDAGIFSFSDQQIINSVFVGTDFSDRLLGIGSTVALYGIKV